MSEVKVLGSKGSLYVNRVLIALTEKGIDYELIEEDDVMTNKSQLLQQCNPVYKKVPVLIHNGRPVCESLIILQYIEDTWPNANGCSLLPHQPYQRAQTRFWMDYVVQVMMQGHGYHVLTYPDGVDREKAKEDYIHCLITLDKELSKHGPYFGGENLNIVDIVLATCIPWIYVLEKIANYKFLDESKCPHFSMWVKKTKEHPSVKNFINSKSPQEIMSLASKSRERALNKMNMKG